MKADSNINSTIGKSESPLQFYIETTLQLARVMERANWNYPNT
jgi:hypothetical protein